MKLRNLVRTDDDEDVRRSAYEGLRSIGPFVLDNGFVDVVKKRNQLARALGYEDYYDYKVTNVEGFGKARLFEMLDGLEKGTRPIMLKARAELARLHGASALEPHNQSYKMAGAVAKKMDPYFPFARAVERYAKSYAALNIKYRGSTMNLDLLDRPGKYRCATFWLFSRRSNAPSGCKTNLVPAVELKRIISHVRTTWPLFFSSLVSVCSPATGSATGLSRRGRNRTGPGSLPRRTSRLWRTRRRWGAAGRR